MDNVNALKVKEGFDEYNAPRQEGDVDLIALVRDLLVRHDLHVSFISVFDRDPLIIEAGPKPPHIQRWLLNRYWYRVLVSLPADTSNARLYLIQDGTEEDWLRLFNEFIIPVLHHFLSSTPVSRAD